MELRDEFLDLIRDDVAKLRAAMLEAMPDNLRVELEVATEGSMFAVVREARRHFERLAYYREVIAISQQERRDD